MPRNYLVNLSEIYNRGTQIEVTASCTTGTVVWTVGRDNKSTSNKQSPNDDVTYTAVCQDGDCRSGEASRTVKMGTTTSGCTPPPAPVVSINGEAKDATVVRGSQIEVTASCTTGTVVWTAGRDNKSTSNKQSPNDDVTYTAVCQDGDCRSGEASRTVKMGTTTSGCTPPPAPVVSINGEAKDATVVRGSQIEVTASCTTGTVVWTAGRDNKSTSNKQSPNDDVTYTAVCQDGDCRSGEASRSVKMNTPGCTNPPPAPVVLINNQAKDVAVDRGTQIEVTASCTTGTVVWTVGRDNKSTSNKQSPNDDVTYTAVCQDGDCRSGEASRTVKMNTPGCTNPPPAPVVLINNQAKDVAVDRGTQIEVTATCSRGTLDWTAGRDNKSNSKQQYPNTNTTYKAVCKEGTCQSEEGSRTVSVISDSKETLTYTGKTLLCNGESSTSPSFSGCDGGTVRILRATGGDQVTGNVNVNVEYAAICSKGSRDVSTTSFYISSGRSPSNLIIGEAINGSESTLTASASGVKSYQWSTGATDASITVSTDATYSVTAYSDYLQKGCSALASKSVTIPKPSQEPVTPEISSPGTTVCENKNSGVTLSVTNCNGTVSWSTGKIALSITVYTAGKYTAYCTLGGKTLGSDLEISNNVPKLKINPSPTRLQLESIAGCTMGIKWTRMENGQSTTIANSNPSYIDIRATDYGQYEATCFNECGSSSTTHTVMQPR